MKPKVFIGSSREGVHIADAIHANLSYDAECTVWKDGVFQLSNSTLSDLIRILRDSDFGIFVFSPDDITVMRGNTNQVVRDNVLFELGLFIGRLGSERSFFLIPDNAADLRLPSDLAGVTPGRYEGARTDGNWMAALNPACMQIKMQMTRLKPFQDAPLNDVAPIPIEKETTTTSFKGKIYLEEYKNSYLIKGDTKPIRSDLKAWASWNPNLAAWVLPKTKKDDFESEFADLLS
ncbi:nucleotide-binding protein [Aeromonas piscicola]|uniref:nucleotide-binding protein n=1 Tax=Aeromonas piscicola TaxID=600645 RepID=UPI0005B3C0DD|nr:nucleotide-binding protein [Aeromonas piscicola]